VRRGHLDEADQVLRQRLYTILTPAEVWIALERGRVAQRRNDPETARRAYQLVSDAWAPGDPEVQPMVDEAKRALRDLGGELKGALRTPAPSRSADR
jgi:hypothetical protein